MLPSVSRGVLLIALGAPEYGNMAANLAASILVKDPFIPIHLVYTQKSVSCLKAAHLALFTSMAECPIECYTRGSAVCGQLSGYGRLRTHYGRRLSYYDGQAVPPSPLGKAGMGPALDFIKPKTHIYDLSPYEETLFLDVDMMMLPLKPLSQTLADLSAVCDFTIKNRGCDPGGAYTYWFDTSEARELCGQGAKFYQSQSEFIFFKKTERNKIFFDKVREVFDAPPVSPTGFRGGVPDEYAYNLAMALTGTYPHQGPYIPVHWYFLEGRKDWNKEIMRDYIGFSIGGESIPEWLMQKINAYREYFRRALKLPYLFTVQSKKKWANFK